MANSAPKTAGQKGFRRNFPVRLSINWPEWSDMYYVSLTPYLDLYEEEGSLVLKARVKSGKENVRVSFEGHDVEIRVKQTGSTPGAMQGRAAGEAENEGFYHRIELPFRAESERVEVRFEEDTFEIWIPRPSQEGESPSG
jgi:HSP20 family molecular chaperone IbpA